MRRSYSIYIILTTLIVLVLLGCAGLPKIIILNDPLSADEHARLGRIYESQGKDDLALAQYKAGIKKDKRNVLLWRYLAELSYRQGDFKTAENALEKAAKLQPKDGDLYNNLAWVYIKQDRKLEKAEGLARKALVLTPEKRPYYLDTLGVVLLRQGRIDEAVRALEEAVISIPKGQSGFLAEVYSHLADAYRAAGDEAKARDAALDSERNYAIIQKK